MQKSLFIILLLFGLTTSIHAQYVYKVKNKHVNLSPGYLTILDLSSDAQKFNHGASLTVAYSIVNKAREKKQRKTDYNRIVDRDVYLKANFSTYKRKQLYNTLGISLGPAFRVTIPEGMFFEFDGQVGYLRTFLKGDFFQFEDETISGASLLGDNLVSVQGNTTIGWNFQKSNDYPVALFVGFGIQSYFPNNQKWLFHPQLQAGITFVLIKLKETYED